MNRLIFLMLFWSLTFAVQAQNPLADLGEKLTTALRTSDERLLLECFNSREEVHMIMETVNEINGGEGVIGYEVDSVYSMFRAELVKYFYKILAEGRLEKVKWKKVSLEAISLTGIDKIGEHQVATIIMVIRYKKKLYMISCPQSFRVNGNWKIGAVMLWEGRVIDQLEAPTEDG